MNDGFHREEEDKKAGSGGYLHAETSYAIIGCAQKVHRKLGPGLPEHVYQQALAYELIDAKVPFETEVPCSVTYDGKPCGDFRVDFVVDEKVVVETKSLDGLCKRNESQLLTYLK